MQPTLRTNRQLVIRAPHDVLRTRPRDVPTPQQQDLLLLRSLSNSCTQLRPNIVAFVQVLPRELWKDERCTMDIFVPVLAPNQLASRHGFAQLAIFVLGANYEPNLPTWVRRDGRKRVFRLSENLPSARKEVFDERQVDPLTFSLCGDGPSRCEGVVEELEVGFLEERLGGADGVGRVGDDDVVRRFVLLQELEPISDVDRDARIGEEGGHVGEVLLGDADDGLQGKARLSVSVSPVTALTNMHHGPRRCRREPLPRPNHASEPLAQHHRLHRR